jgi:heme oxygenase
LLSLAWLGLSLAIGALGAGNIYFIIQMLNESNKSIQDNSIVRDRTAKSTERKEKQEPPEKEWWEN